MLLAKSCCSHPSRLVSVMLAFTEFMEFIKEIIIYINMFSAAYVVEELRRAGPSSLTRTLPMGLLLTQAQGPIALGVSIHNAAKLLSAPHVFTCHVHPQWDPSPGQGAVPWAMLRHYIDTRVVQGLKKTHSKCKRFYTYSHWTSTHKILCCFLHKSRVKELHKEHSSRCLEHWGSRTARQHAT